MIKEFNISTNKRCELIDITREVEKIVKESGVKEGLAFIFLPHSTASLLLTENEPGLKKDWLKFFEKMVSKMAFEHNKIDNNADSHLLSGLIGQSRTLIIKEAKLIRGTWQNIFLAEFDGPRRRKIIVKI